MEMTAARMKADLADLDNFTLATTYMRVRRIVDHLHECEDCRKSRGPEHHALAVLHLGLIEQEIEARGEEIVTIQTSRPKARYVHATAPSIN
ncbi:hypothetical protein GC170_14645 [bacterium]|nr:hypothetical protein [bacterium]